MAAGGGLSDSMISDTVALYCSLIGRSLPPISVTI